MIARSSMVRAIRLHAVVEGALESVGEVVGSVCPNEVGEPVDGAVGDREAGEHHGARLAAIGSRLLPRRFGESRAAAPDSLAPTHTPREARMTKWEYRARNLKKVAGMAMENDFNKHGQEGWEFVAVADGYAIFKRAIAS